MSSLGHLWHPVALGIAAPNNMLYNDCATGSSHSVTEMRSPFYLESDSQRLIAQKLENTSQMCDGGLSFSHSYSEQNVEGAYSDDAMHQFRQLENTWPPVTLHESSTPATADDDSMHSQADPYRECAAAYARSCLYHSVAIAAAEYNRFEVHPPTADVNQQYPNTDLTYSPHHQHSSSCSSRIPFPQMSSASSPTPYFQTASTVSVTKTRTQTQPLFLPFTTPPPAQIQLPPPPPHSVTQPLIKHHHHHQHPHHHHHHPAQQSHGSLSHYYAQSQHVPPTGAAQTYLGLHTPAEYAQAAAAVAAAACVRKHAQYFEGIYARTKSSKNKGELGGCVVDDDNNTMPCDRPRQ